MFWNFWRQRIWYFWAKKLMEIWYLLITGKFLFWTFWWWEIRSFLIQEVDGKITFAGYWEVIVLNFSVMGNTVFFSAKTFMERWYLHGLFELPMIFQDPGNMVFRAVISPPNGSYVKENIDLFLYDNIILNLFYQSNY